MWSEYSVKLGLIGKQDIQDKNGTTCDLKNKLFQIVSEGIIVLSYAGRTDQVVITSDLREVS